MEQNVILRQSLVLIKKCSDHDLDIVAICVNKTCKRNGLVCYNCVFIDHTAHTTECIPINLWRFDSDINISGANNLETSIEKMLVKFKDYDMLIQNYFSGMYEKLQQIKESYNSQGIIHFIGNNLPIWMNYKKIENEYLISNKDVGMMIKDIEKTLLTDFEKLLNKEFKKMSCNDDVKLLKKSGRRFSTINNNWSHTKLYYDCIAFKPIDDGLILVGFGLFEVDQCIKGMFELSIYQDNFDETNLLLKDTINLYFDQIIFEDKLGDYFLCKEIKLDKGRKYILVKSNLEDNPSGSYGKLAQKKTEPFIFLDMKEESKAFRSGNYTDINTGAFPYLIYK